MKPFSPKPRQCKACPQTFVPVRPMQTVCSPRCAVKKVRQDKAEERAKVKTRKEKSLTPSQRRARAQVEVNAYVRLRDADLPCISCGRFHEGQWHAGHYRSRGAAINLALDPRNIHKQCQPCNTHLHGNAIAYRAGLVERYGLAFVEELEADNTPRHYTDADFDAIRDEYRAKTNQLKKERL
ncbi:recombination protein NinG [Comamonas odontotermitis]|uniref:recombination protein NinG n=1 Tax=Comamonas odontotermitis TaxID=379895 RepID=UPI001CC50493|nr:recombination protein NinG [Comamonas odontotermitis]UBB18352.1 recombination protein NinG [Comamonas odontotermitis]